MVVGVHLAPQPTGGEGGQHLVGVHVAAGPGAGLEDVDRELGVEGTRRCAVDHLVAGDGDRLGDVGVQHP